VEYAVLILILLGASYLLVRFAKSESECQNGPRACDRCFRATRPSAERLHQIDLPPTGEKPSADGIE
jgi:hypothetical protein